MKRFSTALFAATLLGSPAWAGSPVTITDVQGNAVSVTAHALNVASQAAAGTPVQVSVSCGTGSTTFLAASTATTFILIKVPASAANAVWFNYTGTAAVTASPSVDIAAGGSQVWGSGTGYLPTAQINCIASSATTVTLVYK